jgi:hypothetical protein
LCETLDKGVILFNDPCRSSKKKNRIAELRVGGGGVGVQLDNPGSDEP